MPSHIHLVGLKMTDNNKFGGSWGGIGSLMHCGRNGKWYSHCVKCMGSSLKVKVELPYNLAISTESMCPHKNFHVCVQAALSVIAKKVKR